MRENRVIFNETLLKKEVYVVNTHEKGKMNPRPLPT